MRHGNNGRNGSNNSKSESIAERFHLSPTDPLVGILSWSEDLATEMRDTRLDWKQDLKAWTTAIITSNELIRAQSTLIVSQLTEVQATTEICKSLALKLQEFDQTTKSLNSSLSESNRISKQQGIPSKELSDLLQKLEQIPPQIESLQSSQKQQAQKVEQLRESDLPAIWQGSRLWLGIVFLVLVITQTCSLTALFKINAQNNDLQNQIVDLQKHSSWALTKLERLEKRSPSQ